MERVEPIRLDIRNFDQVYGKVFRLFWLMVLGSLLLACRPSLAAPTTPPTSLAQEVVVYGWAGYIPQGVLDAFAAQYGIRVRYEVFTGYDGAIAAIRTGKAYDVVVMSNRSVAPLAAEGYLAPIRYENVPNFKNVAASFRDLGSDPGNQYSVPIQWGTTGLVVRTDLVDTLPSRWADLWDPAYAGTLGILPIQRMVIGIALKSLGYSVNSEEPTELEAARDRLLALKPNIFLQDLSAPNAADVLVSGKAHIVYGWSNDVRAARAHTEAVTFVYPEEGTILWLDNLVIPANSPQRDAAELFINFLLDAHMSAQIANEVYVATPNDAARPFIKPELLADPVLFPTTEDLQGAEINLPLSPEGQARYDDIWRQFLEDQ